MPEGYHRGLHRQDEPRIPRRHRDLRRKGVREGLIVSKQWLVVRAEGPLGIAATTELVILSEEA